MTTVVEKIQVEALRLPEDLANQVYDFIRFIEARHGIPPHPESPALSDWDHFFERHTRTVADASPLSRDELYAERLR